ncbi:hypothetical protein B0H34DRAFT_858790 [Crassisporium funariophilum]|nr:hypothetical protein B0H34DRAFT_858790 [Crassisporium funariophilum]
MSDFPKAITKDNRYYIADGNTIILVSHTLFKVHRSILAQDGSMFENMFSLGAHAQTEVAGEGVGEEGAVDDHPICLQGDSPVQFSDLLWSLYALPQEITLAMSSRSDPDILKLANVACLAHKYHFMTVEEWALHAITRQSGPPFDWHPETRTLERVTETAVLCDAEDLLETIRPRWKRLRPNRHVLARSPRDYSQSSPQTQGSGWQKRVLRKLTPEPKGSSWTTETSLLGHYDYEVPLNMSATPLPEPKTTLMARSASRLTWAKTFFLQRRSADGHLALIIALAVDEDEEALKQKESFVDEAIEAARPHVLVGPDIWEEW